MEKALYYTWYEFKKDLQKQLGHGVLNKEWLLVKPQKPLPWDYHSLQSTLSKLPHMSR